MKKSERLERFKEGVERAVRESAKSNEVVKQHSHTIMDYMIENLFETAWRRGEHRRLLRFDNCNFS
jgi:hypothetical protein